MAIIKCVECGENISDSTHKCVHCGFVLNKQISERKEKYRRTFVNCVFVFPLALVSLMFLFEEPPQHTFGVTVTKEMLLVFCAFVMLTALFYFYAMWSRAEEFE